MTEIITKEDMLKIVSKKSEDYFTEMFLRASERTEIIFGFDVKEVDPTNHCYAIFIKLGLTYDGMQPGEVGVPKTGILILILAVIFMKGNRATEEDIWDVLKVTGVYSGRKYHIFGEPRKLITKYFVKEEYLKYQQVPNSDPAQFEFLWGPRAHAETTKMQVLEFMAKVHGIDPSCFPSQYEDALQDEKESKPEFKRGLSRLPWPLPVLWPSLAAPATLREVRDNFLMHCLKRRFMFIEFSHVIALCAVALSCAGQPACLVDPPFPPSPKYWNSTVKPVAPEDSGEWTKHLEQRVYRLQYESKWTRM
ncbi:Melanoma-associated antigen B16 [Myotis brandtii]|uniref:Melanoma-associated antigen B16 n=1 Tax=Myotis brandtii TaxID=109478 RepID=S7N7S3_MYOBR|nr:Melanoma-associated antigen B16 [Myotis brandtii]